MGYISKEDILNATNGGLVIIESYYPGASDALHTRHRKFKARGDEKTASASIRQKENGWYYVTDFGSDSKERNAIEVCMLEEGLEFAEACRELGARYNIKGAAKESQLSKPVIKKRPLVEGEAPGDYHFVRKDYEAWELLTLGPAVTDKHCRELKLESLAMYSYVRKDNFKPGEQVVETHATDSYPLFSFHHEDWQKIYQPNSLDKSFRFRYAGTKPKKHIHGLALLREAYRRHKERVEEDHGYENEHEKNAKKPSYKLPAAFIVSGGSDGLNLRSFGHYPLWFNSESETLEYADYKEIMAMVENLYYIADLDATGRAQAIKLGLKFLDIKLLWLPEGLQKYRDKRGNPRKDFKDFVEVFYKKGENAKFNNRLNKLIENALPLKFWEEYYRENQKKYTFKNSRAYHFLKHMGFGRYQMQNSKEGFVWVWRYNGVVKVVSGVDVKNYVNQFLIDRQMHEDLRDMVYNTSRLNENSLSNLPYMEIDFTDADKESQHLFFTNEAWRVTAMGVERIKYENVRHVTWEDKIIDHKIKLQGPHFEIKKDEDGDWDIQIKKKDNAFLNFLINTSRVHWRKDLEDSFKSNEQVKAEAYFKEHQFNIAAPNLTADEVLEQKLHLINKIYTLGYMLHKYKNPAKPWAPYAMDHKIVDISESHGGSGKSIFLKSLQYLLKNNHYINGRDKKKTSDDFIYHGVTKDTDYIVVDDCHVYMDYGFFYNAMTGDLDVNNKNGLRYTIPFAESPKMAFASNYPPHNLDPSLQRRLLFAVFGDYYHYNKDGEYKQNRVVSEDFGGKSLFLDFTDPQWNDTYNFFVQCLQFYLGCTEKMDPPMENVIKRDLLKDMGDAFRDWADDFFSVKRESGEFLNLNDEVPKVEAWEHFKNNTGLSKVTANSFKKRLKAYVKYKGWIFNPKDVAPEGRIMKKEGGEVIEKFYIRTKPRVDQAVAELPVKPEMDTDMENIDF